MRRFYLVRADDVSGVSGLGVVAAGVVFEDGVTVVHWRTKYHGTEMYTSLKLARECHGHGGRTKIIWVDEISSHHVTIPIPQRAFGQALYIHNGLVHELAEYQFKSILFDPDDSTTDELSPLAE